MQPAERRRAQRRRCDLRIDIDWGAAVLEGAVTEISDGGLFVETDNPLWISAQFSARLALKEPVPLDCVVRRVEPGRGMGLSYTLVRESDRPAIAALLEQLTAP